MKSSRFWAFRAGAASSAAIASRERDPPKGLIKSSIPYPRTTLETAVRFNKRGQSADCPLFYSSTHPSLLRRSEMRVTIALVAILVGVGANGAILAVADGAQPVGGD